jgi:hypothetical protein
MVMKLLHGICCLHGSYEYITIPRCPGCIDPPDTPLVTNIANKAQMYRMLIAGEFGNTIPQWMTFDEWDNDPDSLQYDRWGIRSLNPQDKRCEMNVATDDVATYRAKWFPSGHMNISPMVDAYSRFRGELWDSPTGHRFYGWVDPAYKGGAMPWRWCMRNVAREYTGATLRCMLQHYMNPCSYADFEALLERFPGHVVEFSCLSKSMGKVPGRNTIIWEVRNY